MFSEGTLWKSVCLPFVFFTPPNRTWGNLTSFSHSYLRTFLELRPPVNEACNNDCHWFRELSHNWPVWETRRSSSYSLDFLPVHAEFLGKFVWFTDLAEMFRIFGVFNCWVLVFMNNHKNTVVMAEWLRRWIWNSENVSALAIWQFFSKSFFFFFFLHFLFLFSSTVFRMHPYFGT